MVTHVRSIARKTKLIFENPLDFKYLRFNKDVKPDGIVVVTHESNNLGASILLKHIASELVSQGENVYIISRKFGVLNKQYSQIAPLQITMSQNKFRKTIKKLHEYGYSRIIFNTIVCGDLVQIAKEEGLTVISLIHELAMVIKKLSMENETLQMLKYSDKVVFSTEVAKHEVLNLVDYSDSSKMIVRPQGVYYKKPAQNVIVQEHKNLAKKVNASNYNGVVIGVGNTTERKGFDLFVKTAAELPDVLFLWAGKKESYFDNVLRDNKNNFPNNFMYIGTLNSRQLAGLYSLASVLLMSSRKDTLPSIIFEALLFNVPVIGSEDSGGIVDVINKKNGILTSNASVDAFKDALILLFSDNRLEELRSMIVRDNANNNRSFSDYVSFIRGIF